MGQDDSDRRLSMMEFGNHDDLRDFRFGNIDTSPTSADMSGSFGNMGSAMGMSGVSGAFSQPDLLAMSDATDFSNIAPDVMGNMMAFSNLNMGQLRSDNSGLDMFTNPNMSNQFTGSSMDTDFSMGMKPLSHSLGPSPIQRAPLAIDTTNDDMMGVSQPFSAVDGSATQPQPSMPPNPFPPSLVSQVSQDAASTASFQSPVSPISQSVSQISTARPSIAPDTPATVPAPSSGAPTPADIKPEKTVYSKSGFDMIRALYYVATRPNPEVQLGAVDMSCAFVVCDVTMNDCPIIYVSDNFQNLTGYVRHEIQGKNCRFLQAPTGLVEAGTKREFVDNSAVYNLKKKIQEGKEVQQSLINYRKGGKPFLNLLTMIPIPWDTKEIRYFIGFQIDLVECPDAIAGQEIGGGVQVNYNHSDIGQYIWTPPNANQWESDNGGQTLGVDDVSTLLQQFNPNGVTSDWHRQSWDKMLLENTDDVVHVLSLKGLFLYLSPSCRRMLEYDTNDLVGQPLSSICHPSDIVPVTRELKDAVVGNGVNIVFRIRRKQSGYTWFESHGSLFVDQGKGRKCIILVGRKRPVFALSRRDLEYSGGIGDSELWTKMSTSGMFLFVSSNVRSLLDLQPENLEGTSIQDLMRKESRAEFGRSIEKARRGKIVICKHEVQNRRGQVLQAQTVLYPGDASVGQKPTFLLAQTKLLKASSRAIAPATSSAKSVASSTNGRFEDQIPSNMGVVTTASHNNRPDMSQDGTTISGIPGGGMTLGTQDAALASDDNIFDELKTTRCTSWQYELRQMEKVNRLLAEELGQLLSNKKKRKRRKGVGNVVRDCANCHTRNTPEWRRGPSGQRDLCNSCGLRWAKQTGRVSPRTSSRGGGHNGDSASKKSTSPNHSSPLHREVTTSTDATGDTEMTPVDDNRRSSSSGSTGNGSATATPSGAKGHSVPPQSQPLLAGGSGLGGMGMGMTAISEEREFAP
ncbi:putative white collar 1 protein [Phaeoacremonium minimum UCRPA7]|uniref:Putative white collar 1 protein n=1 Tax=Phaeoacremonium minimum (strain UCR-PA7) TaxID=1286976 RepID=R8BTE2_PHAM7|nr:putative white collar 1 protein [Phaeoacremonium minimum UCRPA7]EOO02574.1 putative white collar 1 protein [Phaeoacremonium minimum UCRPA7]